MATKRIRLTLERIRKLPAHVVGLSFWLTVGGYN